MKTAKKRRRGGEEARTTPPLKGTVTTVLVLLLFLLLSVILFHRVLSPRIMVHGADQLIAGYMIKSFSREYLRTHLRFPMWNPYIFGGLPFVAAMHGDVFFYTWVLRLLLPVHSVMILVFLIQCLVAGLCMFLFLRVLRLGFPAALVSGIAYMFTGAIISMTYAGHDGKAAVASLLPLVLLLVHKGLNSRRILHFILGGGAIGLALISPHIQMCYYLLMAAFFYFAFGLWWTYRKQRKWKPLVKLCLFFGLMLVIGFSFAAIQFLPAYSYLPHSPRAGAGRGYEFATSWSTPPSELWDMFTPHFSGILDRYWGMNYFKQNSEYMGIFPLLLLGVAILYRRRDRLVKFFLGLGIFGLVLALGGHTPLYRIAYHVMPYIKKFRAPSMIFYLTSFSVAVLAGFGLQSLINGLKQPQLRKLTILLCIAIALSFLFVLVCWGGRTFLVSFLKSRYEPHLLSNYGPQLAQQKLQNLESNYPYFLRGLGKSLFLVIAGALLILLLAKKTLTPRGWLFLAAPLLLFDLWEVDLRFIKTVDPPQRYFRKDEVVRFLQGDQSLYRVFPLHYRNDDYLMLYGIQSAGGYHGNQLGRYQEFIGAEETIMFSPTSLFQKNFLDLLNIKYLITIPIPEDISNYDERSQSVLRDLKQFLSRPQFRLAFRGRRYAVYENVDCLPRAFLVPAYEVIPEDEGILARLKEEGFDPRKTVILEEEPEGCSPSVDSASGEVRIADYDPNRILVEAELSHPAWLVLSENHYPCWKAFADGKPVKVYRAYYTLRAVYLGEGRHRVEFVYDSPYFKVGAAISALTLLLLLGTIVYWIRKR